MSEKVNDTEEFCGYPTFEHARDPRLQAFNRIVTFLKIYKERSGELAQQYVKHFTKPERVIISSLYDDIKTRGLGIVRLEIKEGKRYV
jgi:hypothetical protein